MKYPWEDKLLVAARWTAVSAVVISPWLFGGAEPWAYLSVCLLSSVSVAAWLLSMVCVPRARIRASFLTVVLLVLAGFLFVQMVPVSRSTAKKLSPVASAAQSKQAALFEKIEARAFLPADVKGGSDRAAVSASTAATRRSFYLFTAYLGVFLVMANAFKSWSHIRRGATAIATGGFLMAVVALLQKFSGTRDIFWFHTPRFGGDIFGPFTNRNHFAGHLNMALGLTLGLLLVAGLDLEMRKFVGWREKLAWLSTSKAARIVLLGFTVALMGGTVCVTLSRGGIASMVAALSIVLPCLALRRAAPLGRRLAGAVTVLILASVVWLGWEPVLARMGSLADISKDPAANSRRVAARDTLRMFGESPLVGSGFGSFQHVFPIFQSERIQIGRWLHAHNDYVQLLAEGGVVGAVLVISAAALFIIALRKQVPSASPEGKLMVGGLCVGILAIALHSVVDYGLHKPGNAFLLVCLCGMAIAAAHVGGADARHKAAGRYKKRNVRAVGAHGIATR